LREPGCRDVINTVARRSEVGQQMKNALVQILIATVAGVLASLIVMPLQAPVTPLAESKLLMVSVDVTGTKKPP